MIYSTMQASLEKQADQFTHVLSDVAADENNLIRTAIRMNPLGPLDDSDIPYHPLTPKGVSPLEFFVYEDVGMTTGAFLSAMSLRYMATKSEDAFRLARKAFLGICRIYDIGSQQEEGFYPKPYGGRISNQKSRDQYVYTIIGLYNFHKIASPQERQRICRMVAAMADHWMKTDYTDSYFGLPQNCHLDDFMGPLFLGIIRVAYELTHETRFLDEYKRLMIQEHLGSRMALTLREMFRQGKLYDGAQYFRQQENPLAMKSMAMDVLWDMDSQNQPLWAQAMQNFWDDEILINLDMETCLSYFVVGYDRKIDEVFLTEPGVIEELHNPLNLALLNWGGRHKTAGSTQLAYCCAVIGERLECVEAVTQGREILSQLTLDKFKGWTVDDEKLLPPGHAWEVGIIRSNYLAFWLWAYWHGRVRYLWAE